MKIKNKLKKIVLVCSLFILAFCFSIPVFADIATNIHTHDGKLIPNLPDEVSGKHFVLLNMNGSYTLFYWYTEPNLALRHTQGVIEKYDNTGNSVLTYRFGGTFNTMAFENGVWVSKGTNILSSSTMTPPNLRIVYSTFDIVHYDDSSFVFFDGLGLIYKSSETEPEPSDPDSSEPEPSEPEPSEPEPSDPEPSEPEPSEPEPSEPEPSEPESSESDMPTVPIKPPKPVVTDEFLLSFGDFIRGFFTNIVDFKVGLVCFGCILFIGVVGLVFSIARKRF